MHVHAWQVALAVGIGVTAAAVTFAGWVGVEFAREMARYFEGADQALAAFADAED